MNINEPHMVRFVSFLLKCGFQLLEEKHEESFGNSLQLFGDARFFVRIVRDRAEFAIEFRRPRSDHWYPALTVLEFLIGPSVGDVLPAIEENFGRISDLLASDPDDCGFTAFEKAKEKATINRIFG